MSTVVREQDLEALVVGVTLLGSGGGGDTGAFGRMLRRRLGAGELLLQDAVDVPDVSVSPIGVVGATSVLMEKLPSGNEFETAVHAVSRWTGQAVTGLMSLEAGGLNGLTALIAALDLGLPMVDADLMGRALPRLDQFSWAVAGRSLTPCALSEPSGQVIVVDNVDATGLERAVRSFVAQTGGWAVLALAPTPVQAAIADSVPGSLTRALALGRAHAALAPAATPAVVAADMGGRLLGSGRVEEVARHLITDGGAAFGRGSVCVVDSSNRSVIRIETENEYLLALVDGDPVVTTPDLLCVLDRRTLQPIAVDTVRTGDEVVVLALPGPTWWRRPDRIEHVAPQAFGLPYPPQLLEAS
ncbi:DUF917 domain-containing protein [Kribbella solani]|uniref:DUF917 family protein n=1 Tax=Kribbella solani TaxID=236067 RepID=A0A841E9E5_9ACTN|nr:DUF917 domain-containing protein [Kribbella solani]MBB5983858.1 DUF917 family protein [Kribbella solani]